jgi:cytochrome c-type biogenesis protein CcmH
MTLAAMLMLARPLWRKSPEGNQSTSRVALIVVATLLPLCAAGLYVKQTNWSWDQTGATAAQQATAEQMVARLEQRLQESPDDMAGWLMLGRSYLALNRATEAVAAYQKAYDMSNGQNMEAALGLGEALVLTDQTSLQGRAGELFESVLRSEPGNPTALWYGSVTALIAGNLPLARQRMSSLLALNPPQQVRDILERQIQDIDQQLGAAPASAPAGVASAPTDAATRSVQVRVSLDSKLAGNLEPRTPIFVLARDGAGPPLAVVRRAVGDLPFSVTLSDADAMMAGRNLSSVQQVQIVARISKGGSPQAQAGDLFGEAVHSFKDGKPTGSISITIDRVVP